jgi:pSer/pThr/pTyr-binding forkhead associated (FHA) protein
MSVRLTVKMRGAEGEKAHVVMLTDELILLGRDENCQVVLAQQAVSRNHARISRDGSLFFVEDMGSSFGTMINGAKLPKGEKRLLRNGDTIAIAQFDVVFDRVAEEGEGANSTNLLSKKLVKDVMRGLTNNVEQPYFRLMNGAKEGQRISLNEGQELVFGRDETCNVVLQDDLVSRRHAKVRRDISGTHVEDLGSRNGIKVNKKKAKKQTLRDRDELEIGALRLLYIDPNEVRESPVVMPSIHDGDDQAEHTTALPPQVDEAPSMEAPPEDEAPAEAASDTRAEDEEAVAPADEAPEASFSDADPDGEGSEEDGDDFGNTETPEGGAGGFDLQQRRTQIMLGIVGIMLLTGVVLLVAILAGA